MKAEERAAFVNSQVACALIEAMGMYVENKQREYLDQPMIYGENDFLMIITRYGIDQDTVRTNLGD